MLFDLTRVELKSALAARGTSRETFPSWLPVWAFRVVAAHRVSDKSARKRRAVDPRLVTSCEHGVVRSIFLGRTIALRSEGEKAWLADASQYIHAKKVFRLVSQLFADVARPAWEVRDL